MEVIPPPSGFPGVPSPESELSVVTALKPLTSSPAADMNSGKIYFAGGSVPRIATRDIHGFLNN